MNEHDFLSQLQKRAKEQEKIINDMVFPGVFAAVSYWLGNHPWRLLIPLAFIVTLIFHFAFGTPYGNLILRIFGGPK